MTDRETITLYVDGAAKGNPGPAGIGVRVELKGVVLSEHSEFIGEATNNVAEYKALIYGLEIVRGGARDACRRRLGQRIDGQAVERRI